MGRLQATLGYGKTADVELDSFTRLLHEEFYDYEEVRKDTPDLYDGTFEYVGVAPAGSSIYDAVWDCARCTWINNKRTRIQFRGQMVWQDRITGWL